ncbi:MAG TPA: arylsulfotransferase family protein [Solirubrobacteraceae bacterium]|nr:arylsulfotransferase family protein [Solirubrobacteraceae bacterium]
MSRRVAIVLGALVLAWALAALVVGSPSLKLGASSTPAASPACLPASTDHSATLAGTHVDVSPAPETDSANPHTQISFLGAPAADIHVSSVVGERSGPHAGRLAGYSQGDGASFLPSAPFQSGERVSVRASIGAGAAAAARPVAFRFRVDTPYPTAGITDFNHPRAAPADVQSFYTLPGLRPPVLTVTTPDRDPAAGDVFTTNGPGPGQYGALIYTPQGRLVWFYRPPGGLSAEDLSVQSYAGHPDITLWQGHVLSLGFGQGEDLVLSSSYRPLARIPGGNGLHADLHEFQLAPHGVAYISAFNPIRCDLARVGGSREGTITDTAIQEIDIATGLVRWEWHSLDHVAAGESEVEAPRDSTPWDYFHLNSIDPQPDGELLISARSTWAGYLLEGGGGRILWRLGGNRSSFAMGPGTRMAWQHDGRLLGDGEVTFFDDGSNPPIHHQSRGLRVALDASTHTATLRAQYTHPGQPLLTSAQGNMQTLAGGDVVVGFGSVPQISELSPGGDLLFDARLPYDLAFYRAFRFPWSARPAGPPAVLASQNNTGEETLVHASWNGATGVAAWRVLAGASPRSLTRRATMAASGFESSTVLPKRYAYVRVQALDSAGNVLGASRPVAVIGYDAALPEDGRPE